MPLMMLDGTNARVQGANMLLSHVATNMSVSTSTDFARVFWADHMFGAAHVVDAYASRSDLVDLLPCRHVQAALVAQLAAAQPPRSQPPRKNA